MVEVRDMTKGANSEDRAMQKQGSDKGLFGWRANEIKPAREGEGEWREIAQRGGASRYGRRERELLFAAGS